MSEHIVGPVYRDPRGKNDEHCYVVRRGSFVDVHRFPTKADAEKAHAAAR